MEDGPDHRPAPGLGHELNRPHGQHTAPERMQRLSENGARPVRSLGGRKAPPRFRLGALVFQPQITEILYWASRQAPTRIAGCALGSGPTDTRWKNVSSERRGAGGSVPADPKTAGTPPPPRPQPASPATTQTTSFSLGTVLAEQARQTPGRSFGSDRERMHPPSTDGLSAQVALIPLILPAAAIDYPLDPFLARVTKPMN